MDIHPNWTAITAVLLAVTAIATALLAGATVWLVLDGRAARRETAQRDREVWFRAALIELAADIQLLEAWDTSLQPTAPEKWLQEPPLAFTALKDLLARVWVPGALWDRIISVTTHLQAYVVVITSQIRQLPPDAPTRGEYTGPQENIRRLYYDIDLYLKQLACYVIAEMRRQRLAVPKEWEADQSLFAPLSWRYDAGFKSMAQAVQVMEGHIFPPFRRQAAQPQDPAYRECDLERLMERARKKSEANDTAIRDFYNAAVPKPGYS